MLQFYFTCLEELGFEIANNRCCFLGLSYPCHADLINLHLLYEKILNEFLQSY